jgi:apolipoprotein N-acyltransferase
LSNRADLLFGRKLRCPSHFDIFTRCSTPSPTSPAAITFGSSSGADDVEQPPGTTRREDRLCNASFLINPQGELIDGYHKRALVIFGEYIPLVRWLPFMKWFTPIEGQFTRGERAVPFTLDNPKVKTSVLICFEDIFPHLAREYADDDTDFLVNLTNNGWFGDGAAQWQHAASALFRAIENGLPLVRC